MARTPRTIDKHIEDAEDAKVAAIEKPSGGRAKALRMGIRADELRRAKAELVAGNHLPDTPDPPRKKPKPKGRP